MKRTIRFVSGLIIVYTITIGGIGYALYPAPIFAATTPTAEAKVPAQAQMQQNQSSQSKSTLISGKPTRIAIPDYGIDLPIDDGHYNASNDTWTLSNNHAQYALITTLANNVAGNTLIYGHNTNAVFGKLAAKTPAVGTIAEIYTDNDHVFTYRFSDARNLTPNDTSMLRETNTSATLTVQTCTGAFSEWRTMFRFRFQEMIQ